MKILLVLLILSLSMNTISASIDMDDCDEMGLNKYQILEVVNRFETSEDKVNLRTRY